MSRRSPTPCVAIITVAVLSVLAAGSVAAQPYRYVGWTGSSRVTIEPPVDRFAKGRIVEGRDAFLVTDFCDPVDDYYCFFSAHEAFAVPKVLGPETSEWTVRGVRFALLERRASVSILGRKIDDLAVIRSPASAVAAGWGAWIYLYSPRDGLVAFGSEDRPVTFWLEGAVGFGAEPDRSSATKDRVEQRP